MGETTHGGCFRGLPTCITSLAPRALLARCTSAALCIETRVGTHPQGATAKLPVEGATRLDFSFASSIRLERCSWCLKELGRMLDSIIASLRGRWRAVGSASCSRRYCLWGGDRPQGADVFSYAPDENDLVQDPLLSEHLSHWGIDVMKMEKVREGVYVCWRPLSLCAGALLISLGPRQDKAAGAFMHDGLSRSHATWMTDGALLHGKDHTVLRLLDPLSSHSITSLFFSESLSNTDTPQDVKRTST
jgi:hypothetical protein